MKGLLSFSRPEAIKGTLIDKVEMPKKPRKERAKETKPRLQPERELRNNVINELRKRGIKVMRLENSIVGENNTGIADLIVFNLRKGIGGFIELKAEQGVLTGKQPEFQEACRVCHINYWIARSVEEAVEFAK